MERPVWVWLIAALYFFSLGRALLALVPSTTGSGPGGFPGVPGSPGWMILAGFTLVGLVANVQLLRLKSSALYWFLAWFLAGLVPVAYSLFVNFGLEGINALGLFGLTIGCGFSLAVLLYIKRLADTGVLT